MHAFTHAAGATVPRSVGASVAATRVGVAGATATKVGASMTCVACGSLLPTLEAEAGAMCAACAVAACMACVACALSLRTNAEAKARTSSLPTKAEACVACTSSSPTKAAAGLACASSSPTKAAAGLACASSSPTKADDSAAGWCVACALCARLLPTNADAAAWCVA
ncbi:hypothetical protein FA09DRAFT_201768 [Tilletiopsis washingtonensis]|uniref:Uncharacterized protein n=1 Tax=Tilletiopsis washingtonensis TaxID=58919 RepID=A0A316ZG73_9BASI|nr:hypothetical protein FA09DRAFT_201768 [Tilletiopsis washingtonensis]PWO00005.1 hypothetical protein FA09DRAFT_201768 [Tilletiopsis washingtonensis]